MDPYLEHPSLWPDVHNRLVAAIADELVPKIAPRYYVGIERRAYSLTPEGLNLIGIPDVGIVPTKESPLTSSLTKLPLAGVDVMEVELPMRDEVGENYLEVHEVETGKLITVIELLSPVNKIHLEGREDYKEKRLDILSSRTNLVEIDLLRSGEPMPIIGKAKKSDYRIIVSRSWRRARGQLYAFNVRHPIPIVPIPLRREETEVTLDLNATLHALYERARFDLRLNYSQPPTPPLPDEDVRWASEVVQSARGEK